MQQIYTDKERYKMERRQFIASTGFFFGLSLTPSLSFGLKAKESANYSDFKVLSYEQVSIIDNLVDLIIPPTDTLGARKAGVTKYIDSLLCDYYDEAYRNQFLTKINALLKVVNKDFKKSKSDLAKYDWSKLIENLLDDQKGEYSGRDFFLDLKKTTIEGYYTSEAGASVELKYIAHSPTYSGEVKMTESTRALSYLHPYK